MDGKVYLFGYIIVPSILFQWEYSFTDVLILSKNNSSAFEVFASSVIWAQLL
jgi:hypothetical protein